MGSFFVKKWVFHPEVPIHKFTPHCFSIKKYHHALSWMYFCGYFVLSNDSNWEFICIIPIFEVIFGQHLGIWPPGCLYIGLPPLFWHLFWRNTIMLCAECNFALSNGSNWEFICLIPIFWVIFGQNVGLWPPPGVLIYRVTPTVLPLILKKYHYGLSWMYFCCYFVLSNHSNWEFICIIPVF